MLNIRLNPSVVYYTNDFRLMRWNDEVLYAKFLVLEMPVPSPKGWGRRILERASLKNKFVTIQSFLVVVFILNVHISNIIPCVFRSNMPKEPTKGVCMRRVLTLKRRNFSKKNQKLLFWNYDLWTIDMFNKCIKFQSPIAINLDAIGERRFLVY